MVTGSAEHGDFTATVQVAWKTGQDLVDQTQIAALVQDLAELAAKYADLLAAD